MLLWLALVACTSHGDTAPADDTVVGDTGAPPPGCPSAAELDALDARFAASLDAAGVGGGAYALVAGGEVCHVGTAGTRDGSQPVDADTRFDLAEVSGLPVASTAASLVAEGSMSWTTRFDTIIDVTYTDNYGADGSGVTLGRLARHSAGVPDADVITCSGYDTLGDFLSDGASIPVILPPGDAIHLQSDPGYGLLARGIEDAAASTWEDAVRERVLEPAGVTTEAWAAADVKPTGDYAIGDQTDAWLDASSRPTGPGATWDRCPLTDPGTGLWLSVADAGQLAAAYASGALELAPLTADTYPTVDVLPGHAAYRYGYGVMVVDHAGGELVGETGSYQGFSATMLVSPDDGTGIVLLARKDRFDGFSAATDLYDVAFGRSHEAVTPAPAPLSDFSGEFYDPAVLGHVSVAPGDGFLTLMLLDHGGQSFTLEPLGGDAFRSVDLTQNLPYEVAFHRDEGTGDVDLLYYSVSSATRSQ